MTQLAADDRTPDVGFRDGSQVEVRQVNDTDWVTLSQLDYDTGEKKFTVPYGQDTDFASVPRVFVWFLPRYGRYTKAAILHDYLCRVRVEQDHMPRRQADRIFRQAMHELDVAFLRRWIMWAAVRLGALTTASGRQGWLRVCWQVVPIALVALPVVAPPAGVIVAALAVCYVIELIVWLFLEANYHIRKRRGEDPKRVNMPSFLFWL